MLSTFLAILRMLIGLQLGPAPAPAVDVAPANPPRAEVIRTPRVAQVRLAESLAEADAIHAVTVRGKTIAFSISRGDQAFELVATRDRKGAVTTLAIAPVARVEGTGNLSWLAEEAGSALAITHLFPDEDGAVTVVTEDGRRYMVIPGRGSGGNAAVDARWAGAWDHT